MQDRVVIDLFHPSDPTARRQLWLKLVGTDQPRRRQVLRYLRRENKKLTVSDGEDIPDGLA